MIKELREATGAGVMDAKRALEEAAGDMAKAKGILREKGMAAAAKRSDRETSNGVVEAYIHAGGRIGVLVEVNCETDFVANTEDFRGLARSVAMQIAAMSPAVISKDDPEREKHEGTDAEVCLLSQPFIRDSSRTIEALVQDAVAKTGENIRIRRFTRFELGR
ncbi:MAG: elongation factor Ts [Dehalococcoidia bacterium]|jgi:elongation factor Ts|nr:elongation factor Ts [Dehalococcoidia bacterium]MBK6560171.1 elongation factor Ts [Dehalococcoidia bacterium]MBK7125772.1 elongation factor Ts [Dehalococcoidia bacterium]MBK7328653.1 elongation factor Ts [Dehalococcoidia bacterium]MBK7724223.1 elongation factor Ts [Dehalococcoidia bacterium]